MGKRELLIALAFGLLAVVAWWLTAPVPAEGTRPFSLDTVAEIWRNRNSGPAARRASVTSSGTLPAPAGLTEVRLSDVFAVDIVGSERSDVAWTLSADATGRTEEQARANAAAVTLEHDDMGGVLALSVHAPSAAGRTGTLTVSIPSRLAVRVSDARRTKAAGVAAVRLENLVGDVELRDISGPVDGGHRSGALTVERAGAVTLSLVGSTAHIRDAAGTVDLTVRNGTTTVEASRDDVTIEGSDNDVSVIDPLGRVRTSLAGGSISVERPRTAIDIDARRSRVHLLIDRPVPGTVFVVDAPLTLALADPSAIAFDVATDGGTIDAAAIDRLPTNQNGRTLVTNTLDSTPVLAVRGERSSIVIAPLK